MTHQEVMTMLAEMNLPYAYDHFVEGESPDPPYIVKSFFLDNQGFFSVSSINISEEGAIGMDISLYLVRK